MSEMMNESAALQSELALANACLEESTPDMKNLYALKAERARINFFSWKAIFLGLLFFYPGLILICINCIRSRHIKKIDTEIAALQEKLDALYQSSGTIIPQRYIYAQGIAFLNEQANCGRIRTLHEGLDKLDEQEHRWLVEAQNSEILVNQQAQQRQLASIERNAAADAAFSFLNCISR